MSRTLHDLKNNNIQKSGTHNSPREKSPKPRHYFGEKMKKPMPKLLETIEVGDDDIIEVTPVHVVVWLHFTTQTYSENAKIIG